MPTLAFFPVKALNIVVLPLLGLPAKAILIAQSSREFVILIRELKFT
ncbi:hypothetical protein HMPREF1862_00781 [Varibaculum cambriense]|uniref:Uncharacterized protein n=1 Tax=Varibaculum cambriense TaxID=184870 RepID=A0AB34WZV3_9ACTO|nr:hypothetical protein HMPREF1862_00781 [Varibaculum cambriense]